MYLYGSNIGFVSFYGSRMYVRTITTVWYILFCIFLRLPNVCKNCYDSVVYSAFHFISTRLALNTNQSINQSIMKRVCVCVCVCVCVHTKFDTYAILLLYRKNGFGLVIIL
jgi:hypothetical protein